LSLRYVIRIIILLRTLLSGFLVGRNVRRGKTPADGKAVTRRTEQVGQWCRCARKR